MHGLAIAVICVGLIFPSVFLGQQLISNVPASATTCTDGQAYVYSSTTKTFVCVAPVLGGASLTAGDVGKIVIVTAASTLGPSTNTDIGGVVSIGGTKPAKLTAGTLAMQSLTTPVITSVTPSANNGISCSYKLVGRLADNVTSTDASAAVATAIGPTDCNTMTVVWTANAAASYYQLERTGGLSNGLITAMAVWPNNTTNCPASVCTYIDTGSAAAGAAPTVNRTGNITTLGNVGIGTTGPGAKLQVNPGAGVMGAYFYTDNNSAVSDGHVYINSNEVFAPFTALKVRQAGTGPILVLTGTAAAGEVMRVTSGGNVGIGTTTPTALLDVSPGGGKFGSIAMQSLLPPAGLTVTPTCVPGVCNLTWTYTVVANLADGTTSTAAAGAVSTALQNGTLNAASYNTVSWSAVTGATNYTVYRTVSGGTPATVGKLATCTSITALTCVDNGLVGDTTVAPTVNSTGSLLWATDGGGSIGANGSQRPDVVYSRTALRTGGFLSVTNGTRFDDSGNGTALLWNSTQDDFNRLQFGGTTSAFPALKRSGTTLQARLADNSAYASFTVRSTNYTAQTEGGCGVQTDFVVDGVDNTKITSASYTFVAADVGGIFRVTAGAGWTVGDYTIASVAAGAATLSSSPAGVGTAGGTGNYNRGRIVMVQGATDDTLRVCRLSASVYGWAALY